MADTKAPARSVETHIGVDFQWTGQPTYLPVSSVREWHALSRTCVVPGHGQVEHYGEDADGVWLYRQMK